MNLITTHTLTVDIEPDSLKMLDDRLHSFWPLPDNYELASKRLSGLYKRFRQTPAVLQEYDRIIQEQLKGGIVHIVES